MVRVITKLDANAQKMLVRETNKRIMKFMIPLSASVAVFGALGIAFAEDRADIVSGIALIVLAALLVPLYLGLVALFSRIGRKNMPLMGDDTVNVFFFDAQQVVLRQRKGEGEYRADSVYAYANFTRAIENKEAFLLYISGAQAHVVPKADIVEGSADELACYLASALGSRFKTRIPHAVPPVPPAAPAAPATEGSPDAPDAPVTDAPAADETAEQSGEANDPDGTDV